MLELSFTAQMYSCTLIVADDDFFPCGPITSP